MRLRETNSLDGADDIFMTFASGRQEHGEDGMARREENTYEDPLDDVFGSTPASPAVHDERNDFSEDARREIQDPSDIPRLRSVHVTNGYREGLSVSKEQHVQAGFNEGYSLGAELGLQVGKILGVLVGMVHALPASVGPPQTAYGEAGAETGGGHALSREAVRVVLVQAEDELSMRRLFGDEYFGGDGLWTYAVPGAEREGEEDITFKEVAAAHPLVMEWEKHVRRLAEKLGLAVA